MDRIIGLIEGKLEGFGQRFDLLADGQKDLKEVILRHMDEEADERKSMDARVRILEEATIENKGRWKVLSAVAAAASVGGASIKHFLEKFLG